MRENVGEKRVNLWKSNGATLLVVWAGISLFIRALPMISEVGLIDTSVSLAHTATQLVAALWVAFGAIMLILQIFSMEVPRWIPTVMVPIFVVILIASAFIWGPTASQEAAQTPWTETFVNLWPFLWFAWAIVELTVPTEKQALSEQQTS